LVSTQFAGVGIRRLLSMPVDFDELVDFFECLDFGAADDFIDIT
jgi:hypothetical protein